jgi:hypothetical protein
MLKKRLFREEYKQIKKKKNEIKRKILKSIYNNLHINLKLRMYLQILINKSFKNNLKHKKSICIISGKYRSIRKFSNTSRIVINKVCKTTPPQNLKSIGW